MTNAKKIEDLNPNEDLNKHLLFVNQVSNICHLHVEAGRKDVVLGGLAASLCVAMAHELIGEDEDEAMDEVNKLLEALKKGVFLHIKSLEEMEKK